MTRPVPAVGSVRLHILGPDAATSRGYLSADGAAGNHSKAVDGSALTFTASHLEAALTASQTMLEDAFAVAEFDVGGDWVPFGTPYALAPGTGQVIGEGEGSAKEQSPVCVGALQALLSECLVLPSECDDSSPTMRYACGIEGNRYLGWQSKGYDEATHSGQWHDADVYTPPGGSAKEDEPTDWDVEAASAEWVWRDAAEGSLTLFRIGTFTLADRTVVKFISSADEEHKVYLDGPNMGGVIIDSTANETGYTEKQVWKKRLEPGTYRVGAEMTTVVSAGGDGNDSFRFACGAVDLKGNIDTVLLETSSDTRVHRQSKSAERPGMSPMEVVHKLLQDNSDQGVTGADILLDGKTFFDAQDSAEVGPSEDECREWVWPLGTPLSSVLMDMSEDIDVDLSTDFEMGIWLDRGSDLSASVALVPGAMPATAAMNILDLGWESDPAGPTRYLTLSQDGYDIEIGTSAEASKRPKFGFFESGASASLARARANARSAIRQNGKVARRFMSATIMPVTGCVPEDDFTVCDVISGRDYRSTAQDQEVTDVGWTHDEIAVDFTLKLTAP